MQRQLQSKSPLYDLESPELLEFMRVLVRVLTFTVIMRAICSAIDIIAVRECHIHTLVEFEFVILCFQTNSVCAIYTNSGCRLYNRMSDFRKSQLRIPGLLLGTLLKRLTRVL